MKLTEKQKLRLGELLTFKRLITEIYPMGIVSIVSDTYDFFGCVDPSNGILVNLKNDIMARDGKVVIRPDSGDPVKIVTGYDVVKLPDAWDEEDLSNAARLGADAIKVRGEHWKFDVVGENTFKIGRFISEPEVKGMIQCLWEIFGGTISSTGYKQLDSHIGAIYGDAITLERATHICERLANKGFAATNIVFGVGSFTYNGAVNSNAIVTRDLHGFAVKSTYGEILKDGVITGIEIFKDPKTDDGLKKSAKGLLAVYKEGDTFILKDQATWDEVRNCELKCVFKDGLMVKEYSLSEIRTLVAENLSITHSTRLWA